MWLVAHAGEVHSRFTAAALWNGATAIALGVLFLLYATGLRRLMERRPWSGGHSWPPEGAIRRPRAAVAPRAAAPWPIARWRAAAFFAGWAATVAALLGPLDRWSDVLFSAHMAQHEILMLLGAPLMVVGRPFIAVLWALPRGGRDAAAGIAHQPVVAKTWNLLTGPLTVLVLHGVVLWMWHVPALFEAALANESVHVIQHLGFFITAALFWWALIHGRYGRLGYGVAVLYVFATAMHTQILGALLTFGSRVWYPTHAARTIAAGVNPIDDQQFAGILMWIPFGVVFLFVVLALFAAWLGEAERRVAFTSADRIAREARG